MLSLNPINNWSLSVYDHTCEMTIYCFFLYSVEEWWKCFIFVLHKGSKFNVLQCWIFCWFKAKLPLWLQNFPKLRYFSHFREVVSHTSLSIASSKETFGGSGNWELYWRMNISVNFRNAFNVSSECVSGSKNKLERGSAITCEYLMYCLTLKKTK